MFKLWFVKRFEPKLHHKSRWNPYISLILIENLDWVMVSLPNSEIPREIFENPHQKSKVEIKTVFLSKSELSTPSELRERAKNIFPFFLSKKKGKWRIVWHRPLTPSELRDRSIWSSGNLEMEIYRSISRTKMSGAWSVQISAGPDSHSMPRTSNGPISELRRSWVTVRYMVESENIHTWC